MSDERELRARLESAQARATRARAVLEQPPEVEAEVAPLRAEVERLESGALPLREVARDREIAARGLRQSLDQAGRSRLNDFGRIQGSRLVRTLLGLGAAAVGGTSGALLIWAIQANGGGLTAVSAVACVACAWISWRIGRDG